MHRHFFRLSPLLFTLLLCASSCDKEPEKPKASIPYFLVNGKDVVLPNGLLGINAGCKIYPLQPWPEPEDAAVFVSINDHDFFAYEGAILLHDSIEKVSAYAIHPDFRRSEIACLNLNYKSNIFAGSTFLYPNPASDHATLKMENSYRGLIRFNLMDSLGRIQYQTEAEKLNDTLEIEIDVSDITQGFIIMK